jgi:hypothetical protein
VGRRGVIRYQAFRCGGHGADYGDCTDRFDDYARLHRQFGEVIADLEEIIQAAAK